MLEAFPKVKRKVLAAPPDATVGAALGNHGTNQHTKKDKGEEVTLSHPLERGNSREYLTARLKRDHPGRGGRTV